jgi:hypothetical protein
MGEHHRLVDGNNGAVFHRRRCDGAQRMTIQATLTQELSGFEQADDGFLALFGQDRELDTSAQDVANRICRLTLTKDVLVFLVVGRNPSDAGTGQKIRRIELGYSRNLQGS